MESTKEYSPLVVILKTAIVHTVTYFVIGLLALTFLNYAAKYADPIVAGLMRQTSDPWVAAGPLLQVTRGILFGVVIYLLRDIVLARKRGWLILWIVLVIVGILSPFGPSPGSIEGIIYTILPTWFHFVGLPEVLLQSFLLAFLTFYWVNHPERKILNWAFAIAFVVVVVFGALGLLAGLGILQTPT
ncbi:MAG: hypothetical protein BroJett039_07550 [Chloroflexota bacterium]|nr:MAG: hypothetical protein BroJett039_07550 [Chloroflexota bacterium]